MDEVYNFWFSHENLWFNCSPDDDQKISALFKHLIKDIPNMDYLFNNSKFRDIISYIILYDQIVRHVYRNDHNKDIINNYNNDLIPICYKFIENNLDKYLNAPEKCFLLMPLRHSFKIDHLIFVINRIKAYRSEEDSKYYLRFLRSSILSYNKLLLEGLEPENINKEINDTNIYDILDSSSIKKIEPQLDDIYSSNFYSNYTF